MNDTVLITKVKNGFILRVPFDKTYTLTIYSDFQSLMVDLDQYLSLIHI